MSETLRKVVERASTDAAFRAQLASNPEAALAGYGLTAEEKAALLRGDEHELSELGVDARVTKQAASTLDDGGQGPWQNTPFTS
jgi:hypothetical protein